MKPFSSPSRPGARAMLCPDGCENIHFHLEADERAFNLLRYVEELRREWPFMVRSIKGDPPNPSSEITISGYWGELSAGLLDCASLRIRRAPAGIPTAEQLPADDREGV